MVHADVLVAERHVVPARLVAVLHRLAAVAVHRVLHPVDPRAVQELRRRLRRTEHLRKSRVRLLATDELLVDMLLGQPVPRPCLHAWPFAQAFLLRLADYPRPVLLADRLVPLQQVALVARSPVREERLLVEVLRDISNFAHRYSVAIRLEPFIISSFACPQFAVILKKLVVFKHGVNTAVVFKHSNCATMSFKRIVIVSYRLAVKQHIGFQACAAPPFSVPVRQRIPLGNPALGGAVQPPAVDLASLAGADLLHARPVVPAALARAVRVVRRRAGEDSPYRRPDLRTPLRRLPACAIIRAILISVESVPFRSPIRNHLLEGGGIAGEESSILHSCYVAQIHAQVSLCIRFRHEVGVSAFRLAFRLPRLLVEDDSTILCFHLVSLDDRFDVWQHDVYASSVK